MKASRRNLGWWLGAALLTVACNAAEDSALTPPASSCESDPGGCEDAGGVSSACPEGQTVCGGTCVDTRTGRENCGACGNVCPGIEACREGVCVCPSDMVRCDGACIDPRIDAKHCGATAGCGLESGSAGTTCSTGWRCGSAVCRSCRTWNPTPLTHPLPGIATEYFEDYSKIMRTLQVGDLDGDGKLDLAIGSNAAVITLRGRGDGTFETLQVAGTMRDYGGMLSTRLADMDGDGKLDVIVPGGIYYGYGDGTLDSTFQELPRNPYAPALFDIADIDGDGKLDIAALPGYQDPTNARVEILLNRGGRTFAAGVPALMDRTSQNVALADVNADGKVDLVLANANQNPYATLEGAKWNAVSVLLGNGDGTFGGRTSYGAGGGFPLWATVGDLNGDGRPDILSANCDGHACAATAYASNFSFFAGKGDGTFEAAKLVFSGATIRRAVVTDVTDDGVADIVFSEQQAPRLSLRIGQGGGDLLPVQSVDVAEPYFTLPGDDHTHFAIGFDIADVNGDGLKDLITVHADTLSVFLGMKHPDCP